MQKVITMVLYNRPQYTKQVLNALRKCDGIGEYLILPFIEPGDDEVIELVRSIDFAEVSATINSERLGGGHNTFQAWERGFEICDFIVHVEDDTVPAPDCLRFMEHCHSAYRDNQNIFSVASYNRYPCISEQYYAVSTRCAYTCWLVGIWRNRWPWAKADWNPDPNRYATHLAKRVKKEYLREVYPLLSRAQNIGIDNGIHEHSATWHRVYHHTNYWASDYSLAFQPYFEIANPLVTAVMITGMHPDRYRSACVAIECFKNQTYTHRELLIINHGEWRLDKKNDARVTELMVKKKSGETIGDLRNLGLLHAKGDFIICWDDDDWHGPDRIAVQVAAHRGKAAVLLAQQVRYNLLNDSCFAIKIPEGIPNTILYPRLPELKYENLIRGEDSRFLKFFHEVIVVDNDPTLHVCTYDSLNVCNAEHIMQAYADPMQCNRLDIVDAYKTKIKTIRSLYDVPRANTLKRNFLSVRAREEHMAGLR
jgi:hypothetical protein